MLRLSLFLCVWIVVAACAPRSRHSAALPAQRPETVSGKRSEGADGCGASAPSTPLESVTVNGAARSFITHIPESYDPSRAHPLIFAFHGRTNSNQQARAYFGLEAAFPDAIIFYPSGLKRNTGFTWGDPGDPPEALRDFALFDELLRVTKLIYCVDAERVYAVGHSLGGYFAANLGCARASALRAVALLGAGVQGQTCQKVSAAVLHNPKDHLVPVSEGERARNLFLGSLDRVRGTGVSQPALRAFRCNRYAAGSEAVLWCPHGFDHAYDGRYYPHTWPAETAVLLATFFSSLP